MDFIYIGKIVNTHGIKGEVRILSNFKYKDQELKPNNYIYVGNDYKKLKITSYRKHKNFDMVCFENINDINDVLIYKGLNVYFDKSEIKIDGVLDSDLIGLDVYDKETYIGKVFDITSTIKNDLIIIKKDNNKRVLIPYISEFVKTIDLDNKKIIIQSIEGMLDEN